MNSKISGLYKEVFATLEEKKAKRTELELRVDVDGERPMNVISGDLYSNSGKTRKYLSSFRFQANRESKTATNEIQLTGDSGKFDSDQNHFTDLKVTLPLKSHPLQAIVQWTDNKGTTSRRLCKYQSPYFRTVQLEQDYEVGVAPFEPYDTAGLFSPALHRSIPLSLTDAYAEAGIEIIPVKKRQEPVPHPKSIPRQGSIWTDDELLEAMLKHFTLLKNEPQWTAWLFSALKYSISDVKGIMFSYKGRERIGCAVFQKATGWQTAQEKRMRLFIYVHELGHCFNLPHSWKNIQPNSATETNGFSTLSWMNYPWRYHLSQETCGQEAFWKAFKFQFSDSELAHLRHGFRNDVIFGGNTFSEEVHSRKQYS